MTADTTLELQQKQRGKWEEVNAGDWHTACNTRNSWTHSDGRLTQDFERGGRGLLMDKCWSFPPASEREAGWM